MGAIEQASGIGVAQYDWPSRFVESLGFPNSPVSYLANRGEQLGIANDAQDRKQLARIAGSLFACVFIPDTGGELTAEKLDVERISRELQVPSSTTSRILALMVEQDIVKSDNPRLWIDELQQKK